MEFEEIYRKICDCLMDSGGLSKEEIELDRRLIDDLDFDSIDILDLIYEMERKFNISIKLGELEKSAREKTKGPFEENSMLTKAGLETIRKLMPGIPPERITENMCVTDIPRLFTVHSLCSLVQRKLIDTS